MIKLVLMRHGESTFNRKHEFTGWTDIDLTGRGKENAERGARLLKSYGFIFDAAYTSVLKRAIRTLWMALDELDLMWIPVYRSWKLNERHYGALQEVEKIELAEQLGEEQVHEWRRSYDKRPPKLDPEDERHPKHDPKYDDLSKKDLPSTESLKDCIARTLPYWKKEIVPQIKKGKKVLVVAHGNSIRGIIKYLDKLSDEEITKVNIPTGFPLVYELDKNLKPIRRYYLGNKEEVEAAINKSKNQAKHK